MKIGQPVFIIDRSTFVHSGGSALELKRRKSRSQARILDFVALVAVEIYMS